MIEMPGKKCAIRDKHRRSVLLVEDNPRLRRCLAQYLRARDCLVVTTSTGQDALDVFHRQQWDLVLADWRLPDMTSEALLREARKRSSKTACLVMTAYPSLESVLDAFRNGAFDYIVKPFSLNDLRQKMNRLALLLEYGNGDSAIAANSPTH